MVFSIIRRWIARAGSDQDSNYSIRHSQINPKVLDIVKFVLSCGEEDDKNLEVLRNGNVTPDNLRKVLLQKNKKGDFPLLVAIRRGEDVSLIKIMIEIIAGEERKLIVRMVNKYQQNILHNAVFVETPLEIIKLIVEEGGKEVLCQQDTNGYTPIHNFCFWEVSLDIIKYVAAKGGKDALMIKTNEEWVASSRDEKTQEYLDKIGGDDYVKLRKEQSVEDLSIFDLVIMKKLDKCLERLQDLSKTEKTKAELGERKGGFPNLLMLAIWFRSNALRSVPSVRNEFESLILEMIKVGGKDLILKGNDGSTALHYAAFNKSPLNIIRLLVKTAGRDIIHIQNNIFKNTPLHDACFVRHSEEVIDYLVRNQKDLKALEAENKCGQTPFDILLDGHVSYSHLNALMRAWIDIDPQCSSARSMNGFYKAYCYFREEEYNGLDADFMKGAFNELFIRKRYQIVVMIDLYVKILIVLALSPLCLYDIYQGKSIESVWWVIVILFFCFLWIFTREIIQFLFNPLKRYAKEADNYIDIAMIVFMVWTLIVLFQLKEPNDLDQYRSILAMASALSYVELLLMIGRLNYSISIFTFAFKAIIYGILPFAVTAIFFICAFAQMYFITDSGLDNCSNEMSPSWVCSMENSLYESMKMFLSSSWGDYFSEFEDMITIFFAIVMGILLLNILIAVVSNIFTDVSAQSDYAFWTTRIQCIHDVTFFSSSFHTFFTSIHTSLFGENNDDDNNEFFYDDDDDDDEDEITNNNNINNTREGSSNYDNSFTERLSFANSDYFRKNLGKKHRAMEEFFNWWFHSEIKEPKLGVRLFYFFCYASISEIIFDEDVFKRIYLGKKYNAKVDATTTTQKIVLPILNLLKFILVVIIVSLQFVLGFVTFGLVWSREMQKFVFFGPIRAYRVEAPKFDELEQKVDRLEKQNAEILEALALSVAQANMSDDIMHRLEQKLEKQNNDFLESLSIFYKNLCKKEEHRVFLFLPNWVRTKY